MIRFTTEGRRSPPRYRLRYRDGCLQQHQQQFVLGGGLGRRRKSGGTLTFALDEDVAGFNVLQATITSSC